MANELQKGMAIVGGAMAVLGIVFGVGYIAGWRTGRGDYFGPGNKVERMEILAGQLGDALEAVRKDNERYEDSINQLSRDNIAAGKSIIELRIEHSALSIRNRELIEYAESLEAGLRDLGVSVETVAADIGRYLPAVDQATSP